MIKAIIGGAMFGMIYFLPTAVAMIRKKRNVVPIFITNLVFGWTLIIWIIAIIWATMVDKE